MAIGSTRFFSLSTALFNIRKYSLFVCVNLLVGCGSGGSGEEEVDKKEDVAKEFLAVKAIDGYIRGANVYLDLNGNYQLDSGEPTAITGEGGVAQIDITDLSDGQRNTRAVVEVKAGAVDEDTISADIPNGTPYTAEQEFQLSSFTAQGIATPFTTIINILTDSAPSQSVIDNLAHTWNIPSSALVADYVQEQNAPLSQLAKNVVKSGLIPKELTSTNSNQVKLELELLPTLIISDIQNSKLTELLPSEELIDKKTNISINTGRLLIAELLKNAPAYTDSDKSQLVNQLKVVNRAATGLAVDTDLQVEEAVHLLAIGMPFVVTKEIDFTSISAEEVIAMAEKVLEEFSPAISALKSGTSPEDLDGDGVKNDEDALPLDPTEQLDTDNDGTGDNSDEDIDGDGVINAEDAFPFDPAEQLDTDNDGIGNNSDSDIDGDGAENKEDAFPLDPAEQLVLLPKRNDQLLTNLWATALL